MVDRETLLLTIAAGYHLEKRYGENGFKCGNVAKEIGRPSSIGISIVSLLSVEKNLLHIQDPDEVVWHATICESCSGSSSTSINRSSLRSPIATIRCMNYMLFK